MVQGAREHGAPDKCAATRWTRTVACLVGHLCIVAAACLNPSCVGIVFLLMVLALITFWGLRGTGGQGRREIS